MSSVYAVLERGDVNTNITSKTQKKIKWKQNKCILNPYAKTHNT